MKKVGNKRRFLDLRRNHNAPLFFFVVTFLRSAPFFLFRILPWDDTLCPALRAALCDGCWNRPFTSMFCFSSQVSKGLLRPILAQSDLPVENAHFRLKPSFFDSSFFDFVFRLGDPVEKAHFFDKICQSKNPVDKVLHVFF